MSDDGQLPFEEAFRQLEGLVTKLEEGGLSLDQTIELYEEGMKLAALCEERLEKAELRITQLREAYDPREEPAETAAEPLDAGDEDIT